MTAGIDPMRPGAIRVRCPLCRAQPDVPCYMPAVPGRDYHAPRAMEALRVEFPHVGGDNDD